MERELNGPTVTSVKTPTGVGALLLTLVVATLATNASGSVIINGAQTYQTIDGFGVNANSGNWTNNEVQPVLDALIDQAGMTLFLAEFVGNDNWETFNANPGASLTNWSYFNSVYSGPNFQQLWGMMAYLNQRGITNGLMPKFTGATALWMGGESLSSGHENDYAKMLASALIYARQTQHLQFTEVPPLNEPDLIGFDTGVQLSGGSQYVTVLDALGGQLDANGMSDVRFSGPELATTSTSWMGTMMGDAYLMSKLAHFGLHSYIGNGPDASGVSSFIQQSAYPNTRFWMTEFGVWCQSCLNGTGGDGSWTYASGTAAYMLTLLAEGATGGIVFEAWDGNFRGFNSNTGQDTPGSWDFFGLFAVSSTGAGPKSYTPRKQFYTFSQITKYVRPGATRIGVSGVSSPFTVLAFNNTNNGQFTLTGLNTGSSATALSCSLTSLPAIPSLGFYYTSSTTNLCYGGSVAVNNGAFSVVVPANCVFTLTYTNTVSTRVAPPTILLAPTNQTLQAGATAVLSVQAVGTAPLSYQWYLNTTNQLSDGAAVVGSTSNILTLVNVLGGGGGAYTVAVSNLAGVVTSTPPAVLTVIDPVITAQPVSRTNLAGSAAVFSVQANGAAPAYQWYKNGQPVSGGTQAGLTLAAVTDSDAGGYSVVVSNAYGSAGSSTANLTVWDPPVITATPSSGTNLAGTTAVLSVQAVGTAPLSYQWYRNVTNALSDGFAVTGSTSNVLTLVNVLGGGGGAYTVVVSNLAGVVTSTPPAVLTVIDPVITAQPASRTNLAGSAAVFGVQVNGTAPAYQWYKNGQPVSGGTQAGLTLAAVTDSDAGGYSVVVSNAYGSASSTTATLIVWDLPVITAAPSSGTNLAGTTAILSVQAVGSAPLSYQWYRDTTNQLGDGAVVVGSASNILSLVNVLGADAGAYTVVVSNLAGVVTSTPPAVLMVIDPVITAQPVSRTNLAGSVAMFSVQASGTAPQYQWYKDGQPVSGGTQAGLMLAGVTDGDAGGYSVVVSNAYGSVSSTPATLTVWDPPVITAAPSSGTNPAGTTAVLSVQAVGSAPLSYQWYRDTTNQLGDGAVVVGSASNILTLVNVLGADAGAYTVVVSNLAGVVTSTLPAVLTVIDPVITAQPVSQTNLAGSAAVFNVQASGTAPQYQWYKDGQPVSGGTQAGLMLAGVTDGDAGGYIVVVSNAYGSVSSTPATLTVWDPPVITTVPADGTNEAGATVVLSVQAVGSPPLSYQWYRDTTNQLGDGAMVAGSTSNILNLVNVLGADSGAYTLVVSNLAGAVTSTPPTRLTVIDPVILAPPASRTNHAGSEAVFSVQAYGTAPGYQWYKNGEPVGGGTQAELVLEGVTDGDAGEYSVVVSNAYGGVSSSADLMVVSPLMIEQFSLGDGGVAITWNAVPGQSYLLQYKDNLYDTDWTSVLPAITAIAPNVLVTNPLSNPTQHYYRITLAP